MNVNIKSNYDACLQGKITALASWVSLNEIIKISEISVRVEGYGEKSDMKSAKTEVW